MPKVPYDPVPTVAPDKSPQPYLQVPGSLAAATGQGLARAGEHFGAEVAVAGNMLERQALGRQELENDTWARNANVDAEVALGTEREKYNSLEGTQATAALPAYQERVKSIRQEALDRAPNDSARKMLDASLARRVGFALVDGGGHAATEAKVANRTARVAEIDNLKATADGRNPESLQAGAESIITRINATGQEAGMLPETISRIKRKELSQYYSNAILKLAPNDPEGARNLYDRLSKALDPAIREDLDTKTKHYLAVTQTKVDAGNILKSFDVKAAGREGEVIEEARKVGDDKYAGNPQAQDLLVAHVRAGVNLAKQIYADRQQGDRMLVEDFIRGQKPEDRITDVSAMTDLSTPKEVRDAWTNLSMSQQRTYAAAIAKGVAATNPPYTAERQARYHELLGLSQTNPKQFTELSVLSEDLPRSKIDDLRKRQLALGKHAEPDQEIGRFLTYARPILQSASIGPSSIDETKAAQYNQFIGAFETEINAFKAANNKPPNDKEAREIARGLVTQVYTNPDAWIFKGKTRRFELEVPAGSASAITDSFRRQYGREPSADEVRAIHLRLTKYKVVQ